MILCCPRVVQARERPKYPMERRFEPLPSSDPFDDRQRIITQCPLCTQEYGNDGIRVLEECNGSQLLHMTCPKCSNAMLAMVVHTRMGLSSIGMLTDLSLPDAKRLHGKGPVSEDDILSFHLSMARREKEKEFLSLCLSFTDTYGNST